jgi:cellulose biosynthesis protein BcsQ
LYIVTFYSFKGGVGRTMALVNVGAELARTGASVLLVDFDLEAPSLMNFNLAGTSRPTLGIVDYVLSYQRSGQVPPDIDPYICESETFANSGRLAIMPAGARGVDYPARLMGVNWQRLYGQQSGFLLLEELKAQWSERLRPDYVLIDSRTGHNEEMGICTRQLPDAVCAVFLPNAQNLEGLTHVVSAIREQKTNSEGRDIKLHFVASNVPYADDERGTLETALAKYRERLRTPRFDVQLHHYPTLALLGQDVLVLNTPKLALAQEYRDLSDKIRSNNLQDRSSALKYLRDLHASLRSSRDFDGPKMPARLDEIGREHSADAEVLYWLARVHRQRGAVEQATVLLDRSIDQDPHRTQAYLERASLRLREFDDNRLDQSRSDFLKALEHASRTTPVAREVAFIVHSLATLGGVDWNGVANAPAIQLLSAEDRLFLVLGLDISDEAFEASYQILRGLPSEQSLSRSEEHQWRSSLSLSCIRLGRFAEAAKALCAVDRDPTSLDIDELFNFAMACWGAERTPAAHLFSAVLTKVDAHLQHAEADANFFQCLAISSIVCGRREEAAAFLGKSREEIRSQAAMEFSAWRYLRINPIEFDADLDDVADALHTGATLQPLFMRRA